MRARSADLCPRVSEPTETVCENCEDCVSSHSAIPAQRQPDELGWCAFINRKLASLSIARRAATFQNLNTSFNT